MSDISAAMPATQQPTAVLPAGDTATAPSPGANNNALNGANPDTFLQLLVAELRNQNPSNPTDPTQFLTQTAQFEQVQELNALQTSIAGLVSAQQTSSATSMLGMQVTGQDSSGKPVTGVVSGYQLGAQGPLLSVGNGTVALSSVTSVAVPGATPTASTTSTSTTSN